MNTIIDARIIFHSPASLELRRELTGAFFKVANASAEEVQEAKVPFMVIVSKHFREVQDAWQRELKGESSR